MSVLFESTIGTFVVDLDCETSPKNCNNFLKLSQCGFYTFCNFYSVERGFVAKSGSGREDLTGKSESQSAKSILFGTLESKQAQLNEFHISQMHARKGTISMLEGGGTRFFITLSPNLIHLDNKYTVIGHISEGIEIIEKLNELLVDSERRPFEDVVIKKAVVLHDPFQSVKLPSFPAIPSIEAVKFLRIDWIKEAEKYKLNDLTIHEEQAKSQSRALTLELLGDLPDAGAAPPENVLFVCRLNPMTQEDDLKIVFSRFGKVLNCRIVCDRETKKSLGYGFVEFQQKESCELAYSKMQNAIIDDRKIHVDFSQSLRK
jgi:peptidyl-prolyl cis-trans isomerase-like 4